ncbi:MAG: DNA polymerase III subunit gamma/tau [Blastomonas sp.]
MIESGDSPQDQGEDMAAQEEPGFAMPGLDLPKAEPPPAAPQPEPAEPAQQAVRATPPTDASGQPYRVLARKYRPQSFAGLIGQDAMVQTLGNAIKRERLAHAFLLTGVRGVGKTSTARLIAKALNCIGPDGTGGPTIAPCGVCEPCVAIAEGRHIDVIEMDAASHTGVDDVREIIEAVRYSAVSARFKIYIIDEVHMLSKNAFNALLKTLEEPPPHVKFLFATTEVNKIPITVLSRCQRFDLKRIPVAMLADHFASICAQEQVTAEPEALGMIAEAAEGSVRDGLSILDQAIAHAAESGNEETAQVNAAQVRTMLGLSDRDAIRRLFGHMAKGDADAMLAELDAQHDLGVAPVAVMRGLMNVTHGVTLHKTRGASTSVHGAADSAAIADWAETLGHAALHRLWQLLLKGHDEVENAPVPREACEMALLRVAHAATMPDPDGLARLLTERLAGGKVSGTVEPAPPASAPAPQAQHNPPVASGDAPVPELDATSEISEIRFADAADLVSRLEKAGQNLLAMTIRREMRPIEFGDGHIVYQTVSGRDDFAPALRDALFQMTKKRWRIERGEGEAGLSLNEQDAARKAAENQAILDHPLVQAAHAAFPDMKILHPDIEIAEREADTSAANGA